MSWGAEKMSMGKKFQKNPKTKTHHRKKIPCECHCTISCNSVDRLFVD